MVRGSAYYAGKGWRIPAPELERAVIAAARAFLDDQAAVLAALEESGIEVQDVREALNLGAELSRRLSSETEAAATLIEIIKKVQLSAGGIQVHFGVVLPGNDDGSASATLRVNQITMIFPSASTLILGVSITAALAVLDWYVWRITPVRRHPLAPFGTRSADDGPSSFKEVA